MRKRNRIMDVWAFVLFLVFLGSTLISSVGCDRSGNSRMATTMEPEPPDKNKPGIVKQTFEGNESNWVPGVSAAVIVIIVFFISIFACCIHCPFCIVYRRNDSQRVV